MSLANFAHPPDHAKRSADNIMNTVLPPAASEFSVFENLIEYQWVIEIFFIHRMEQVILWSPI